jgi:hypothetical protein
VTEYFFFDNRLLNTKPSGPTSSFQSNFLTLTKHHTTACALQHTRSTFWPVHTTNIDLHSNYLEYLQTKTKRNGYD